MACITKFTPDDDNIIRELYPTGGARACVARIPRFTMNQIQARAARIEVQMSRANIAKLRRCGHGGNFKRADVYLTNEQIEEACRAIRREWPPERAGSLADGAAIPQMESVETA